MGLDVAQIGRRHAGVGQCLADDGLLRRAVGSCQAVAAAVLVDGRAAQDGQDIIAVAQRIGQALEDDDAGPLPTDVTVGAGVKRLAAAVGSHHPRLGEGNGQFRREQKVDAAGQGQVALATAQTLHRQMGGDERRGTGRVDGQTRPAQIQ